jgi:alpha-beta hydrolase superfamily lysophospholipase
VLAVLVILLVSLFTGKGGGGARTASPGRTSGALTTRSASQSTSTTSAAVPKPAAPYRVGATSLSLSRPATPATATGHSATGAPIRPLPTIVRYPAVGRPGAAGAGDHPGAAPASASGPFPLVVFSQGYDLPAEDYAGLLDAWARAGYVVADPTYPLTDPTAPGGVNEQDIVNHPADLRFVVSALIAASRDRHSVLHGLVNASRVAVIGHSDGGDVSLAAAANTCCRDAAVRAAVILSGAELSAFGGRYFGTAPVPLLVVQGSADTINVPGCSAQIYDGAPRPRYYLDVEGAEHEPPYLEPGPLRDGVVRGVVAFLDAYLRQRPASLERLVGRGAVGTGESLTTAPLAPGTSTSCPGAP